MATFHETSYIFTINGPQQQKQNSTKCRRFALFVENSKWKSFRHAKDLGCRVQFARKLITVYKKLMFYPRQAIF